MFLFNIMKDKIMSFFKLFKQKGNSGKKIYNWAMNMAIKNHPSIFEKESTTEAERIEKFEKISAYMAVALWSLKNKGEENNKAIQHAQEIMFEHFDIALREQGVGDMKIGREVKNLAAAFLGRLSAYSYSWSKKDEEQLKASLLKNNFCEETESQEAAKKLMALATVIDKQDNFKFDN